MKKPVMTNVFVLILCIIMVLTLTACGSGSPATPKMEGKYVISSMMYGDEDFLEMMRGLALMLGEGEFDLEEFMYFEFSGTDTVTIGAEDEVETGTYKIDGNTIAITIDGETMTGTVDGDSFTIEEEDEDGVMTTMTFSKKQYNFDSITDTKNTTFGRHNPY